VVEFSRYVAEYNFSLRVLSAYARLVGADRESAVASDLSGKLFYAGELDEEGRALVVASNIAGAASVCATANEQEQKQAVRDGIVDFLVMSLDEALRILKNEIRKREPVSVCIGSAPAEIERQMSERGVAPDVYRPGDGSGGDGEDGRPTPDDVALVSWSVWSAPVQWMPKLDAFALQCAGELDESTRRWLQMSPRYLGRLAQSFHLVLADRAFATRFMEGAMALEDGKIPLKLQVSYRGGAEELKSEQWREESGEKAELQKMFGSLQRET
jgi:hypothetical protein